MVLLWYEWTLLTPFFVELLMKAVKPRDFMLEVFFLTLPKLVLMGLSSLAIDFKVSVLP